MESNQNRTFRKSRIVQTKTNDYAKRTRLKTTRGTAAAAAAADASKHKVMVEVRKWLKEYNALY